MAWTALKYDVELKEPGRLELDVLFPVGAHGTASVIESGDTFDDLFMASASDLDFWDNPFEDEDWNDSTKSTRSPNPLCSKRSDA